MKITFSLAIWLICYYALTQDTDSLLPHKLPGIEISGQAAEDPMRLTSSTLSLLHADLKKYNSQSLVSAVNTLPGVRMEERSPGSYRFSVRGSLLRSPFGVRNIRVYLAEFPFSDAGGNTYLNSLDVANLQEVRIIKGPQSSLYGANTGGALIIDPVYRDTNDSLTARASLQGGSYGHLHQALYFRKQYNKHSTTLYQAFQQSRGYREHSAMKRIYLQAYQQWRYNSRGIINLLLLYSDLQYQTPGGLTPEEFKANPASARPATNTLPGAMEQQAGVYNRSYLSGISHYRVFGPAINHVISISLSGTDFKNPFITNFEHRNEHSIGLRTYADIKLHQNLNLLLSSRTGLEWQHTISNINNHINKGGRKGSLRVSDKISTGQSFFYTRFIMDIKEKALLEASASLNIYAYRYKNLYPYNMDDYSTIRLNPQFMPRLSFSYLPMPVFSLRGSVSMGYSPPTIPEIRASDNIINTELGAERGINIEIGVRAKDRGNIVSLDATLYYYRLNMAIVRRVSEDGSDYFVNAGNTRQPGFETDLLVNALRQDGHHVLRLIQIKNGLSLSLYRFGNYVTDTSDFTGKKLTGVPSQTVTQSLFAEFAQNISLHLQYNFISSFPLNDANTYFAKPAHLLQARATWIKEVKKTSLTLFLGGENLLNQRYSLGYDLNAFGNRFYNAAAPASFYLGINTLL